ncbi:MAG TPA: hypothetical protein VMF90_05920 [Rhizobiaceae bacterium]|nr:hypothetical protein [Rhizobiaceae bacterium]
MRAHARFLLVFIHTSFMLQVLTASAMLPVEKPRAKRQCQGRMCDTMTLADLNRLDYMSRDNRL